MFYIEFNWSLLKFNYYYTFGSSYLNSNALDEMGERISELEQSINDLRAEMGAEGTPPPAAPKSADGE
ncbi:putative Heat shock factor binding 1 [Helianthus annuus]|nr:putative Heat shock factor binding 1 [Helianthus annuus]